MTGLQPGSDFPGDSVEIPCSRRHGRRLFPSTQIVRAIAGAQVVFATEFDRGAAHVDADTLAATGAQPPQLIRCQRRGGDGRLRRGVDRERGGSHKG